MLEAKNINIKAGKKEIVKGVSLQVKSGEIHALMGPNGSGKSTFAQALAGQSLYKTQGRLSLDNKELLALSPDKRAKLGLFLGFQNPVSIPGVRVFSFLKQSFDSLYPDKRLTLSEFREKILKLIQSLDLDKNFLERDLNYHFSGGERKRLEVLQALVFKPKYVVLDEIDSGIDLDGLKLIKKAVLKLKKQKAGIILITHQPKILKLIRPNKVHLMIAGRIVASGNEEVIKRLEVSGYKSFYCLICQCPIEKCPHKGNET